MIEVERPAVQRGKKKNNKTNNTKQQQKANTEGQENNIFTNKVKWIIVINLKFLFLL